MSVTSEINSSAAFTGNAALGGYAPSAIDINTTPLAELAKYTMLYNEAEYKQRQKDTDAQIAELAKISEISLNDLYESDKAEFMPRIVEHQQWMGKWARETPKTQAEKLQHNLDYQIKNAAIKNDYTLLKAKSIKYQKTLGEIDASGLSPAEIDLKKQKLKERMQGKDIYHLEDETQFATKNIKIPVIGGKKLNVFNATGGFITDNTIEEYDYVNSSKQADVVVTGVAETYIPETIKDASGKVIPNPAFTNMTPLQKEANKNQLTTPNEARDKTGMAAKINPLLQTPNADGTRRYYDANGTFLADKFETDFGTDPTVMGAYNLIKDFQSHSKNLLTEVDANKYASVGVKGVIQPLPKEYIKAATVGFDKGAITEKQLVEATSFNGWKGRTVTTKVDVTDRDIKQGQLAETKRNNTLDYKIQSRNATTAENKLILDAAEKNLEPNGKGGWKSSVKTGKGTVVVEDFAEGMKDELKTTIGSGEIPFSNLSVGQQGYIVKAAGISNIENSTITKTATGFTITTKTKDAEGKETGKTTKKITETEYKITVNEVARVSGDKNKMSTDGVAADGGMSEAEFAEYMKQAQK